MAGISCGYWRGDRRHCPRLFNPKRPALDVGGAPSSRPHRLGGRARRGADVVFDRAIIAQQGAFYFRRFGADLYVVDMVGVLVLREIGVLLTAIMVAGRSGSAFTAELGAMKMREEIDAMRVIGLNPIEVLVAPRCSPSLSRSRAWPLSPTWPPSPAGALVSVVYVGIPLETFLQRLNEGVYVRTFLVGVAKAPFMALIIAVVACMEGMKVEGSTDSLGRHTTEAVVKAIFLVIVVDGLFAMFYAGGRPMMDPSPPIRANTPEAVIRVRDITVGFGDKIISITGSGCVSRRGSRLCRRLRHRQVGAHPRHPRAGAAPGGNSGSARRAFDPADRATRTGLGQRLGVLFQHGALFSSLTVAQNIMVPMRST